jgi:hypothetical protein
MQLQAEENKMFTEHSDKSGLVRWGGVAGVAAAVMLVLVGILILVAPQQRGVFESFGDYLIEVILIVTFVGTLVTIVGLHVLHTGSGRYGRLGAASALITFLGYALIIVVTAASTLAGGQVLHYVRVTGGLAVLIGLVLLGVMILRTQLLPWWCGVLLIVGFPVGDLLDNVAAGSEAIVFGIVWGAIGYALLSIRGTSTEPVAEKSSHVN